MTTFAWPTSSAFKVENCSIYLRPNVRGFTSQYSGGFQGIDLIGEVLCMSFRLPLCATSDGALRRAFFNRLRGVHWISAYNFASPQPQGTQRGALALTAGVAQGSSAFPISGGTNGATLLPGDMLGVGTELFEVADVATFNGSGLATVQTTNRVHTLAGLPLGSAVVWDRPATTWRLVSPVSVLSRPGRVCDPLDVELIQVW